jgi:hypothetical protein
MAQVSVVYSLITELTGGVKGTCKSHYCDTLKQADRRGVIRLNDAGKIVEVINKDITVNLPKGVGYEDVYELPPAPKPE